MNEWVIDKDIEVAAQEIVQYFQLPETANNFLETRIQKLLDDRNSDRLAKLEIERHKQRTLTFYKRFISPSDLVFDIGANVGDRTEAFRKLGAKVVAVEPHPSCVKELEFRFKADPEVTIIPRALGGHVGIGKLFEGDLSGVSSLSEPWIKAMSDSGRFGNVKWSQSAEVEIDTLDLIIARYGLPNFVKIDVEGSEDRVLEGLSTPLRTLSFEFHTEFLGSTEACIRKLERLGPVRFTYSTKETFETHPEWVSGAKILEFLQRYTGDNTMYGDVYACFN